MTSLEPPDTPTVTVIALCYNHERFLERCLDSIARQTLMPTELIVTDDASTDSSPRLIRDWLDVHWSAAVFIEHRDNRGLCATINEALSEATGRYVALIATDDVMQPDKLLDQVARLEECGEDAAVVYSDVLIIDEDDAVQDKTYGERNWWFEEPPEGDVFEALLRLNFIPAAGALIRRSALVAVGGYDESLVFEDWDMWLRLADRYQFVYSARPTAAHRVVSTSLYHTRRIAMAESKVRLLSKWLDKDCYRDQVVGRIRQEAHYIYQHDRRASLPYLRKMCDLQGGWRSWGRYLLARFGVSYGLQQRVVALTSRRR